MTLRPPHGGPAPSSELWQMRQPDRDLREEKMQRGPICLMLFRFGKWQGNGNSKNATALRQFINADEDLMFLSGYNWLRRWARPGHRRRGNEGA
jgi:hypothetical protein